MAPVGGVLLQLVIVAQDIAISGSLQYDPPSLRAYAPSEARLPAIHNQLLEQDEFLMEICERLV
jgi:hypothetical protein